MQAKEQRSSDKSASESEIRDLVNEWMNAVRDKDFDKIMSHYSDDVTAFDVPPPLQIKGAGSVRENIINWLTMFEGPAHVEFKDQKITADENVAFLHTLTSVTPENEHHRSWVRVTVCYEKVGGRWLVTHEHASLPFNGQSTVEGLQS